MGHGEDAKVALNCDEGAGYVMVENRELGRCRRAVIAAGAGMRRDEGADVANVEQLTWPGAGQQVVHEPRIGTADEQDGRVLAGAVRDVRIGKSGFERFVANAADNWSLTYGLFAVAVSLALGWAAALVFRR